MPLLRARPWCPVFQSGLNRPSDTFTRSSFQPRPEQCDHCMVLFCPFHPYGSAGLSLDLLLRGPQPCPTVKGSARSAQPGPPANLLSPHPALYEHYRASTGPLLFTPGPAWPPAPGYYIERSRSGRSQLLPCALQAAALPRGRRPPAAPAHLRGVLPSVPIAGVRRTEPLRHRFRLGGCRYRSRSLAERQAPRGRRRRRTHPKAAASPPGPRPHCPCLLQRDQIHCSDYERSVSRAFSAPFQCQAASSSGPGPCPSPGLRPSGGPRPQESAGSLCVSVAGPKQYSVAPQKAPSGPRRFSSPDCTRVGSI
ncbi:hypothetical protein NDU88_002041 [Pleurodeles waltl]|uniref:Uncharacterized protein n=1 Tax=Pleurodeles waltl TaxID=8319 RepID=A0AAV7W0R5_PLEWA|nr:hypothetical protein NDU88_002041 [Pleurodeles waltl]